MSLSDRTTSPSASSRRSPEPLTPGLLVLHGNRLELLQEAVFTWLGQHPLDPLEQDVLLVQSNGIAEWMKMSLAQRSGICAATRVELPARFLWRLYRAMLGRDGAPARSPLDKAPLTWRLMQSLPEWIELPGFEPLAQFLAQSPFPDGSHDLGRRLQLAERLADLYDQYQIYRADWLAAWARGEEVLLRAQGRSEPLPEAQRWQARLWRLLVHGLDADDQRAVRSDVHRRFVAAVEAGAEPQQPLPRRVVLFGHSHLPSQTLEALAALSRRSQVLLAVPNPCQFHWADIIEGRELLRVPRQRHPHRKGEDLGLLSLDLAHAQAHPLLAAWGRQGRDFIRLLDAFDDAVAAHQRFQIPRIDLFDDGPGETLLAQVQSAIRDGLPLKELQERHRSGPALSPDDRSIVFQVAHTATREVEVLHDQLLTLLAQTSPSSQASSTDASPLAPRDIVVMVPDIEPYAPIIDAVFGQYPPTDERHIPYEIADLRHRGRQPLLLAVEWLLRVTEQRCTSSELRDLLEVPALARRFGLHDEQRSTAARWLSGAGVRWGLDAEQRSGLGLGACGNQNSSLFGLRRMLLGYASGRAVEWGELSSGVASGADAEAERSSPWQQIAPYEDVGGLDAAIAGSLAALIDALRQWWRQASQPARPRQWHARCLQLLDTFLEPVDEDDRLMLAALSEALGRWLDDCEAAGFDTPLSLAVLREGWLSGVDEPGLNRRFLGGGVVFCTLMPMRAIPFQVVCLLGMNDGDYPRQAPRSDFDLMVMPGLQRPGDRARRDDDRMLMLEALLAARRVLSISWAGRSVRDNTVQPPSVLVSQLRDHVAAGWGDEWLARLTTEHPLQPFSRRYFEAGGPLTTYAREWREAHVVVPQTEPLPLSVVEPARQPHLPEQERAEKLPLNLQRLAQFLRNPVKDHFRERLGVVFEPIRQRAEDEEPFVLTALDETVLLRELLKAVNDPEALQPEVDATADAAPIALGVPGNPSPAPSPSPLQRACTQLLMRHTERLVQRGDLPMGGLGQRWRDQFVARSVPMWMQWQAWRQELALPAPRQPVRVEVAEVACLVLEDWLDDLRCRPDSAEPVWLSLEARSVGVKQDKKASAPNALKVQPHKLIEPWLRMLVAGACGVALEGRVVARDVCLHLRPPPQEEALSALHALLLGWEQGMLQPLPVACRTALNWLAVMASTYRSESGDEADPDVRDKADEAARKTYEGDFGRSAEVEDDALARMFSDWEALNADGTFAHWAQQLYGSLRDWAQHCVTVQPLPQAATGAAAGDEDRQDDNENSSGGQDD